MTENPLAQDARLIEQAFALIDTSPDPLAALLAAEVCRGGRQVEISRIAAVDREGCLAEEGYKTPSPG
jgi:hypothetical protein